jgi:hypothetical protein
MFYNCYLLKKIDISCYSLDIATSAFSGCRSLKALIIRNFDVNETLNTLVGCYHITGTVDATYNPTGAKDGYIYVPRFNVNDLKYHSQWKPYASQLRVLEDYTIDGTTTGEFDDVKAGL